ncbi:MAG TPA: class I SAM-dependent methyltransferase [Amycolatopsis sp.]|nr:class I SAM-dependent methyltransferase [Amycolatopsis sp.]
MAESFGIDAERYDRARPRYPDELVNRIVDTSPGRDFLDVGCGTGIDARQFQAAGAQVLGVDPDPRMAEFARSTGVEVEVAKFEDWDAAGRDFDAVVAGQAWHWVDPVAGAVKAARVLRPRGRLVVFGHVYQPPAEIADAFNAVYRRLVPGAPFGAQPQGSGLDIHQAVMARFADGFGQAPAFGGAEHWQFEWERTYTRDEWLDFMPTTGGLTRLPAATVAELLESARAAIDRMGGGFTMSLTTLAVTAARHS